MHRRTFIKTTAAAVLTAASGARARGRSDSEAGHDRASGYVWRPMISTQADIPALNGHTDTVPDIVGRLGARIDLAIFTEGNHFPALFGGGGVIDAFRSWVQTHSDYSALSLDNIVITTLSQPIIVDMLKNGGISFGDLTLDVSRTSGFYPDIVMAGISPLQELHAASIVDVEARVFARNRGLALVVAAGNPLGIHSLDDLARNDIRVVLASENEPGARRQYISALKALLGPQPTQAILSRETVSYPGRIGIQHRDVLYGVATRAADVGIIFHHLALYYASAYPEVCSMVQVPEASQFSSTIAMVAASDCLRGSAAKAFSEFLLDAARDIYPSRGFATMSPTEYGARVQLG